MAKLEANCLKSSHMLEISDEFCVKALTSREWRPLLPNQDRLTGANASAIDSHRSWLAPKCGVPYSNCAVF